YSTLTRDELRDSYEHASPHLDWGQANAGETRHKLDYYYGINLSRALSLAVKSVGKFKILSSGRVQGPALKIIVDLEKEIRAFKPEPFWQIELHAKSRGKKFIALHKEDKFWEKKKADKVMEKVNGKRAFVDDVDK
ncbi:MAG: DNA topoisomerase, partial [Candidatus Woesearchaeota archaeon]|nr:DNA topoisomerase [Candidatus Woesearchaeota archaeon]